jgi:lysophospholipid acyltransferase
MQTLPPTAKPQSNGKAPEPKGTKWKPYYDVASWLITQVAFSFTVIPFIVLTFRNTMTIWARVYFYCIIGVLVSLGFLFSPGKVYLQKQLSARTRPGMERTHSAESMRSGTTLGLPNDPEREVQEIVAEVRQEIENRRARGMSVDLDVRKLVEEKMKDLRGVNGKAGAEADAKNASGETAEIS